MRLGFHTGGLRGAWSRASGQVAVGVPAALVVASLIVIGVRGANAEREMRALTEARQRHAELRDSLAARFAGDPTVRLANRDSANVVVALKTRAVVSMLQDVSRRYLDRVEVDLGGVHGYGKGEYRAKTLFGRNKIGEWNVEADVHELRVVVSAGTPRIETSTENRLRLAIPAQISPGAGTVTVRFHWNSKSVFNALCRDFEATRTLRGRVLRQDHVVHGEYVLSAGPRGIVVDPDFPAERYPIAMELDEASWNEVRGALEEQDERARCGLLIDPDQVVRDLRAAGLSGLRFRLPHAVMRRVVLPATIQESVRILDTPVALEVRPHALRLTRAHVVYSADVGVRRASETQ